MQKARLHIKRQLGFSPIEILLAVTIFGFLATAVIGAFVYGRASTASSGERQRALLLADEGAEAVRNIRDAAFTNLTNGTYGITQSGGVWTLSGSSDTTGIFTRQITIASNGVNRKTVTSTVSWTQGATTSQVSATTQLTRWMNPKSWTTPAVYSRYGSSLTSAGYKVATAGNYAYVALNVSGATNFMIFNISGTSPVLVGSATFAGALTNVAVSGNYAYVSSTSDTSELQIINVSLPASPTLAGTFDAAGTADALGVTISGTYAYLARAANAANNELVVVNVSNPAATTRTGYLNLNVSMYEVYVNGANLYVVTSSDTQEVIKITTIIIGAFTTTASINLPGTTDTKAIAGYNDTLFVAQGTSLRVINGAAMSLTSSLTVPAVINEVAVNDTASLTFLGITSTGAGFQVANTSTLTAPTLIGTTDTVAGASGLTGLAYNSTYGTAIGVQPSTTGGVMIIGPN